MKVIITIPMASSVPAKIRKGGEVWVVNNSFGNHQKYIDRVYFMDPPEAFGEYLLRFRSKCNEVHRERGARIVAQREWNGFEGIEGFPLHGVIAEFPGCAKYFTSTIAYMVASAIYEGADEIVMWGVHMGDRHWEYQTQRPCIEFWCGIAVGRGIKLTLENGSKLMKSPVGSAQMYGYAPDNQVFQWAHMQQMAMRFYSTLARKLPEDQLEDLEKKRGELEASEINRELRVLDFMKASKELAEQRR